MPLVQPTAQAYAKPNQESVTKMTKEERVAKQLAAMKAGQEAKKAALEGITAELKAKYPQGLPEKVQAWLDRLTPKAPGQGGAGSGQKTTLQKLFGDTPVVGTKVSHYEAFLKTAKGPSALRWDFKTYTDKGVARVSEVLAKDGEDKLKNSFFILDAYTPKA